MDFTAGSSTSQLMAESESIFSATLLLAAWNLSCSVHKSGLNNGSYERVEIGNTVVFAFRGSADPSSFTNTATKYGEYQIKAEDNIGFLDGFKDGRDQRASVHQGALTQFRDIWERSSIQKEISVEYDKGKIIVFTGHSMGGGIAALATLWLLEKQGQPGPPKSVFCITFGFPLIGDEVLARAVRRKKWADHFCNVVSRRDVFSRILLAPSISVSKVLGALLLYWNSLMQSEADSLGSNDIPMEETLPEGIAEFVATVVQHCSAVSNYTSAAKMSPNNPLIAAVRPLVKLSPYRPFGYYLFCSTSGGIWIENHFAVLPILYFSLQTLGANLKDFISEHVRYGYILPNALNNKVKLNDLSDLPLSEAGLSNQDLRITIQLDALGLGIQNCQARLALRAAGQVLKQQLENVSKLETEYPPKMEIAMRKLEEYRSECLRNGTGYFDAFKKKQRRDLDFQANLKRLELAGWWDEIIQNKFDKDELPDDFQCSEEWIKRGTHYRLLVEPLDIANFYRLGKNEDSGPYLTNGRPSRYKTLQKWLENAENNKQPQLQLFPMGTDEPKLLTQDSCLWADVEDISNLMHKTIDTDEKRKALENRVTALEKRVRALNDSHGLCMEDVLIGESTLKTVVSWLWLQMNVQQQATSPFGSIIHHPLQTAQN